MLSFDLNGKWKMKRADDAAWLDASVPGSVYADLLAAGKMEDPFYRDNEDSAREISRFDFEYERVFELDREILNHDTIRLVCEGLDTIAEISVNSQFVNRTDNMHRRYEFDVKGLLRMGSNVIRVMFRSPIAFIEKKQAENPLWGIVNGIPGFPNLRKAHFMFGWDWGPQLPDMGIWRNIRLDAFSEARILETYVVQRHEAGKVRLNVRVNTEQWGQNRLEVSVRVTSPDGREIVKSSPASGSETHVEIDIAKPELWWPNGFGKQPLYRVETRLLHEGEILDERDFHIGLRTMKVRQEKDEWGQSFEFNVNGISIFAMGADYIPEDNVLSRSSRQATETLIKNCVAANFNCLRVWGGGLYPDDYFFELCDRYGLLVWHDLMFACAVYDLTKDFAENIKKEAEDNIRRIRHHASLGLWCGNNEMEMGWLDWDFPKSPKLKTDYIRQFEILLADVAKETDPETFYWPSSPSSGGGFDDPNNENRGDVHYWDVWHGGKPFTEYRKFFFRFASEFGFQSFPSEKTVATFTRPEDRNIFSRIMEKHQKNGEANGKILLAISENFKYPKDFASLLYASQLLQAEAMKYGVEHWRRNRGRCMGAVYWQLNDCWPVASWASLDYFGRWKALHYFAKRFYEPVLLSVEDSGTTVAFNVSNETQGSFRGELLWKIRDHRSEVLRSGTSSVGVAALSAATVARENFADLVSDDERARTVYLEYSLRTEGNTIRSGTLLFAKAKHFEFLDPEIGFTVDESPESFVITLRSKAFAKYVELVARNFDCVFSDNYFDLSAGEERVIEVKKASISPALDLSAFASGLGQRSIFNMA